MFALCFAKVICLLLIVFNVVCAGSENDLNWGEPFDNSSCALNYTVIAEIAAYKAQANEIQRFVKEGPFKYKFFNDLLAFVDTFGSRLSGSEMFESSVAYMYQEMNRTGLGNLHAEPVYVPNWIRQEEEAFMLTPRIRKIAIVGFGKSVPTPPEGIKAEIIIIPSFQYLQDNRALVAGKIAVFDLSGKDRRRFKTIGGPEAYKSGALVALCRSVVSMSVYTVSARSYSNSEEAPIPMASITDEDMDLFVRLTAKGASVTLYIVMKNTLQYVTSKNLVGDYRGRENEKPHEFLILSGHMDSWDISQGAQDNGCGSILAMEIPQIFAFMNIRPRRTVRTLLTVGSEYDFLGTRQYVNTHSLEMGNHIGALIGDAGCAKPQGYILTSKFPRIGCILQEIAKLFEPSIINQPSILINNETFTLADVYKEEDIPNILMNGDAGKYYWVRHTYADTMSHVDYNELDDILVFWATTAYVLADLQNRPTEL